jgi:succinate dehydrogenase / fumarate reductase iron-sulfur subunit
VSSVDRKTKAEARTHGLTRRVTVTRGDRSAEYSVRVGKYTTVLDALEQIRGEQDKTLLYRHSCHHGSCGTCGVVANGTRVLGCVTPLADLDEPVHLRPLSPYPVIGDLAVDPRELYKGFPADVSILRPSETSPEAVPPAEIESFTRFENCIECGLCESVCPVLKGGKPFRGPAALAAYGRELEKNPDRADELLEQIDSPEGVWGCDRALQCSVVCPLGVAPARHIAVLQRRTEARKSAV